MTHTPLPWYAVVDDCVGGWALATRNAPASQLLPGEWVAGFTSEEDATLMANASKRIAHLELLLATLATVHADVEFDTPEDNEVRDRAVALALGYFDIARDELHAHLRKLQGHDR